MEGEFLTDCLAQGMSLKAIGEKVGKHPSTVSYWLKKHGLRANGSTKHAGRGSLCRDQLMSLADGGATLTEMAEYLDRSVSTVRYWLVRYGLRPANCRRPRRRGGEGRTAMFECRRHGSTEFRLEGRGHYRCKRCRSEAVVQRRRKVKRKLGDEARAALALSVDTAGGSGLCNSIIPIPGARNSTSLSAGTLALWLDAAPRSASVFCSVPIAMPRWREGSLLCRWIRGHLPAAEIALNLLIIPG